MKACFFIVGPTAVGKSELAAEIAQRCAGEIVSADAFQIYAGLDLLTAKPEPEVLRRVPHHLIGTTPISEAMDAERFRAQAAGAIASIHGRGRPVFVVGGSGLYLRALTDGLSPLPPRHPELRARLQELTERELSIRLERLDPATAATIDRANKRRLVRALEICLLTGRPAAELRRAPRRLAAAGIFLFREREELNERINQRVAAMFTMGVIEEVRALRAPSETAERTLGVAQIRALLAGRISEAECIAQIQQATRRYAKRQLTWFRHQTIFEALNLTGMRWADSVELLTRKALQSFARTDD